MRERHTALGAAIRRLRSALDETQEGMARRLGCTLSGYIQWEKGRRIPGGDWLLKLMALCPDEDTRSLFEERIDFYRDRTSPRASPSKVPVRASSTTPEQRKEARAIAREAIEILYELGQAGYRPADQKLRRFADELNRVAGDFSHAFPRPR
ncbi:MAG: helix-turn-helix transcriptional regulator [Acidobacteria bacterium]|nr:helix-turn-helix transcriptional regulator [Acidobacteriota bacterium]